MSYEREIRHGADNRFRTFTIHMHMGQPSAVEIGWAKFDESAADLVRKYSAGEMGRLVGRSRFYHLGSLDAIRRKLLAWRKKCVSDGLTITYNVKSR